MRCFLLQKKITIDYFLKLYNKNFRLCLTTNFFNVLDDF